MEILSDRVLVLPDPKRFEDVLSSGLIRPILENERYRKGTVVLMGYKETADGIKYPLPDLQIGDKIMFGKTLGDKITLSGKEHLILRYADIICVIDPELRVDMTAIPNCDPNTVPEPDNNSARG
jgi:co-chaperonin GroES (HSP10)